MRKNNEIQVIDRQSCGGIRVSKADRSIEFSPEISQQICSEIVSLGAQMISGTGKVTVEYFKTQADMYYAELNTYISNQGLKSEERKMILEDSKQATSGLLDLINKAKDSKEREELLVQYERLFNLHAKKYIAALHEDSSTTRPQKSDLMSGLLRLFGKKS